MESVEVAIIGGGQAGLATSWYLKQAGVEHVILEAGRVAQTWRSRRWDSFCLVTPNWTAAKLPGGELTADPNGFMPRDELVDFFERWARSFDAPVMTDCKVASLEADGDGFRLTLPAGALHAHTVVVATGGYQRAHRPAHADQLPNSLTQLLAEDYRNPHALPPGGVLIVGSGQTGLQLAEELHGAGRNVIVACGRCSWAPRRFGGRDFVWWVVRSGFWDRTAANPAARLLGNVQSTGHGGGHDLHFRVAHAMGIELAGRFVGVEDGTVYFADDLNQTLATSDDLTRVFRKYLDDLCARERLDYGWEMPPPLQLEARTALDLRKERIATVIWTAGYRPDYGWVRFPIFDDMGFPVQVDGHTEVRGLYFTGVHFQRKAQSAVLHGAAEDAQIVVDHITATRR